MKNKRYTYVANWKMNMPYNTALLFFQHYANALDELSKHANTQIIICPSTETLAPTSKYLTKSSVQIGAQNCSGHTAGSYTGETSAQSLAELGCNYTIVGHSERRRYHAETSHHVAEKVAQLFKHSITPIICIGETAQERNNNLTKTVITDQLAPILPIIERNPNKSCIIAYEPVWAIGSGEIPTNNNIQSALTTITDYTAQNNITTPVPLLYGGSVNEDNAAHIRQVPLLDGFLIGNASLDFKKLKNIVL